MRKSRKRSKEGRKKRVMAQIKICDLEANISDGVKKGGRGSKFRFPLLAVEE